MAKRIVILGGGTGGTLTANRLRRTLGRDAEITVVDQDDRHVYQPGSAVRALRPGPSRGHRAARGTGSSTTGIDFIESAIDRVDLEADEVHLDNGATLAYDVLVVATGARLVPEETEGLAGPGWMEKVFTFYTPEGAAALADALAAFDGGRLVVNVVDMPIKCPVAPLEFCFLADWYFTERGIRDRVEITYATPLDGAFTKPIASAQLGGMLAERGIELVTEFNTGEVDGVGGRLIGYDGREVPFDLAVVIPLHGGADVRRPLARPRRRARLRAHRRAHAPVQVGAERLRDRRRRQRAGLEGRFGHPLRGRDPREQRGALPRRRAARGGLRRARELLHRDRATTRPC